MWRPALIFDFGNVVAHFDYTRACAGLGQRLGLSGGELLERLRARGLTRLVGKYESGRMTSEQFSRSVCGLAGLDNLTHEEFQEAWCDIFWLNEPVARLVRTLRRREYTLVLGSNTNDLHAAHFRRQFAGTLAHFDRLVLSYDVGSMKPEPEFYLACAEAAGQAANRCVFIDDIAENVEGARAIGMRGVLYHDEPTLRVDLARLGVEVSEA